MSIEFFFDVKKFFVRNVQKDQMSRVTSANNSCRLHLLILQSQFLNNDQQCFNKIKWHICEPFNEIFTHCNETASDAKIKSDLHEMAKTE